MSSQLSLEVRESVSRWLTVRRRRPRILCGDLNSPKIETAAGEVIPWARPRDQRRVAAELGLMAGPRGLQRYGMVDVFRAVHGYERNERSWFFTRHGSVFGYRLDHIMVSQDIAPLACWYEHAARTGLSDHSPMVADLQLPGEPTSPNPLFDGSSRRA
jgi:exonuclease III